MGERIAHLHPRFRTPTAAIVFRRRPGALRFKAPGYPRVPALFVASAGFVVASSIISNPGNALLGSGLIGLGVPAYLYWRKAGG